MFLPGDATGDSNILYRATSETTTETFSTFERASPSTLLVTDSEKEQFLLHFSPFLL